MSRTKRTVSRVAGVALALTGAAAFMAAGQASANDRAVVVSCTDSTTGTWTVSVTFSAIEVREDRPVQVTLGSDSATLTEPGPNGTVTLQQTFGQDQSSASLVWSVVRLDYQNMGKLNLDRPAECEPPTTEAPPSSEAPPTEAPPASEAPTTVPVTVLSSQATPAPSVQNFSQALPETGRPTAAAPRAGHRRRPRWDRPGGRLPPASRAGVGKTDADPLRANARCRPRHRDRPGGTSQVAGSCGPDQWRLVRPVGCCGGVGTVAAHGRHSWAWALRRPAPRFRWPTSPGRPGRRRRPRR